MLQALIVDDEKSVRELLGKILEKAGVLVDKACCGEEALKKLNEKHYDLLITDVIMPRGGGMELLERMRLLYPDIVSIVISANSDIDSVIKAMQLGASGFVLKPFRREEIQMALRTALENRRLLDKRSRMRILTNLVDAGKEIATALDIPKLAEKIVLNAHRITNSDTASLMLIDEKDPGKL